MAISSSYQAYFKDYERLQTDHRKSLLNNRLRAEIRDVGRKNAEVLPGLSRVAFRPCFGNHWKTMEEQYPSASNDLFCSRLQAVTIRLILCIRKAGISQAEWASADRKKLKVRIHTRWSMAMR